MKKIAFIISILFSTILNAQINLEHTFTPMGVSWFISDVHGLMYYSCDTTSVNQLKFYDDNYSLLKTVSINKPAGYSMGILLPSDKLFNSDNLLEFICVFTKYSPQDYQLKLFNENGILIKDFGSAYFMNPYLIENGNTYKLLIRKYIVSGSSVIGSDEIYSLPGSLPNKVSEINSSNLLNPFPNPTNDFLIIPNTLSNGTTAILKIYNQQGQLVDKKNIQGSYTNEIRLNTVNYTPGLYYYEYNGISNKFIVK